MNSHHTNMVFHKRSTAYSGFLLVLVRWFFYNRGVLRSSLMPKKPRPNNAQILLFPANEQTPTIDLESSGTDAVWRPAGGLKHDRGEPKPGYEVVMSGSFRRDIEGLKLT